MVSRRSETICRCPRSSPIFSSTLLFLSLVLPSSSYAQITNSAPSTDFPSTTLQTSAFLSVSPSPTPTATAPARTTQSDASITPSVPPTDPDDVQEHVFNYYFLIIALPAILFCVCILYVGRRKKQKAILLRSQSQRALATDVAGFRARFGNRTSRTNGGSYGGGGSRPGRIEGLNERGEAPPPYVPGAKPPSIRSMDGAPVESDASDVHGFELEVLSRPQTVHQPPKYDEHIEERELGVRGTYVVTTTQEGSTTTTGLER